jgi:hypothetical protein
MLTSFMSSRLVQRTSTTLFRHIYLHLFVELQYASGGSQVRLDYWWEV